MMKFSKLEATGNDFILIDARDGELNWNKLAKDMCHRNFGIGADGIIIVTQSKIAELRMRIYNSDGSEAQVSGNGLRCFAKYAIDEKIAIGPELKVETLAGIRAIKTSRYRGKVNRATVNMGTPQLKPAEIPVNLIDCQIAGQNNATLAPECSITIDGRKLTLSLVSMGNPHAVHYTDEPVVLFPINTIGEQVENNVVFPERINFEIARVLNYQEIEARVWERGVGETLSCGSGACAIAVTAMLRNLAKSKVDIILPGGTLTVTWDGVGEVFLDGPVEEAFIGEWLR